MCFVGLRRDQGIAGGGLNLKFKEEIGAFLNADWHRHLAAKIGVDYLHNVSFHLRVQDMESWGVHAGTTHARIE